MDNLVERMKTIVAQMKTEDDDFEVSPPVSEDEIQAVEISLGFPLPPLLKALYLNVGNGGFGPGHGLLTLSNEESSKALQYVYHDFHRRYPHWHIEILPICDWGCGIYSFVDCQNSSFPVIVYDGNLYYETDNEGFLRLHNGSGRYLPLYEGVQRLPEVWSLIAHRPSLETFIVAWMEGVDLWEEMDL
jgi:hypothetical protein